MVIKMVKVEGTLEKKNRNNYDSYKKSELTKTLILGLVGLVLVLMPGTLNKILGMMETLKGINTDGVEPLKSPFDNPQPLREDVVSEQNHREDYQAVAPATQDGLYLVPRVIE